MDPAEGNTVERPKAGPERQARPDGINYDFFHAFQGRLGDDGKVICDLCLAKDPNHPGLKNEQHGIASHISSKHLDNSAYKRDQQGQPNVLFQCTCGYRGSTTWNPFLRHIRSAHGFRGSSKDIKEQRFAVINDENEVTAPGPPSAEQQSEFDRQRHEYFQQQQEHTQQQQEYVRQEQEYVHQEYAQQYPQQVYTQQYTQQYAPQPPQYVQEWEFSQQYQGQEFIDEADQVLANELIDATTRLENPCIDPQLDPPAQ